MRTGRPKTWNAVPHLRNSFLHIRAAPYRPFVQNLLPPHQTKLKNNLRLPKCNNRELEKQVNAGDVVRNGSPVTNAS
jgi:hypothetical protein